MKPIHLPASPKILLQRADKLGDVILILPVLDALLTRYPDAEIHVLTSEIGARFLNQFPTIAACHVYIRSQYGTLIKTLRREKFNAYISLWNTDRMAWLGVLCGIPIRMGDATNFPLKYCYTHAVRQHWEDYSRHQIEFNLDLLKPLGIDAELKPGIIPVFKDAEQSIRKKIDAYFQLSKPLICIFNNTGGTNNPIPWTAMTPFIHRLIKSEKYHIVLAGQCNPDHDHSQLPNGPLLLNLLNQTTLHELCELIRLSDYYIGPDTGPTHLASFLQKPMLFFSSMKPNPPTRWGPLSPYVQIIRKEYDCPYLCVKKCHPNECFAFVTPELLQSHFQDLDQQVQSQTKKTLFDIKRLHMIHSFRILDVRSGTKNPIENPTQTVWEWKQFNWQKSPGWSVKQIRHLLQKIVTHNITILQGDVPFWVRGISHLMMGTICRYIPPIYIDDNALKATEDRLTLYQRKWGKR